MPSGVITYLDTAPSWDDLPCPATNAAPYQVVGLGVLSDQVVIVEPTWDTTADLPDCSDCNCAAPSVSYQ